MSLPPTNYKSFEELAEYARQRAKISAVRNGHQEFAYWLTIHNWANDCADEALDPGDELVKELRQLAATRRDTITAQEFARAHGVSVSTINRACNGENGRKIKGHHRQESNGRWRIDPAAHLVTSGKHGRRSKNA